VSAPALSIESLALSAATKSGLRPIVSGVSLTVGRGEIVGLVGESGSGKSQTALAVTGLNGQNIRRTAGRIFCDGEELSALSERDLRARRGRKVAYVFQDPMSALNPTRRIGRQILDVLDVVRPDLGPAEARAEAARMLSMVGLHEHERVLRGFPFELSGGMRQRVLIALAFACRPTLIVADEPTTALDVTLQAQILKLIAALQADAGVSMLFISHDLAVVQRICSRLYVMRSGQIVESGRAADVLSAPSHTYTRELIASARAKEALP
jgi:peptide/nickel transport system ATP-binding protein